MARSSQTTKDPRQRGPKPPQPKREQSYPGSDAQLEPKADHGEQTYRGSGRLQGKKAVITGADSGIGRAVALAFAREGADVLISFLSEDEDAKETARWVEDAGRKAVVVEGDIQDQVHCQSLVERALREFGQLDLLINNAAYQMAQESLDDITTEQFDRTFKTNVYAMFYLCKAAVPHMKPGSCIINTSSIQAFDQSPTLLDYASTKCAIVGFTKALAKMVIEQGIRVNAVAPGPVWTPLIPATFPAERVQDFGKNSQLGRAAQPAEIAPLFVWLASADASYVTAEVYAASGGRTPY